MKMKSNPTALYVHIPFCKQICSYCDFAKVIYQTNFVNDYFESLFFELENLNNNKYDTIYIGGGTPSCLDNKLLVSLLEKLQKMLNKNYEFSIESNVEDINETFLETIKRYGVNRLSIGIQTFNKAFISLCNRKHSKEQAINNVKLAFKYIENINVDMIYGFPFQLLDDVKEDLEIVSSLPIKHISYYSLIIEENTVFYQRFKNLEEDNKLQAKMYKYIYSYLKKQGFNRYEISNFAKTNYKCKHNLVYWHNMHYDAVGLNASGYVGDIRFTNTRNLTLYNNKQYQKEIIKLTKEDKMFEEIMLYLRLDEGLNLDRFYKKYNVNFIERYNKIIKELEDKKLIKITKNKLKTTFKGSLLLNQVLISFMN